jgi:small subunit ribosomal protein S4
MGDPKKRRKQYTTPKHPWQKERIDAEKEIEKEYGTATKKEIWKVQSMVKNFHKSAIKASALTTTDQSKKEFQQLVDRLVRMGLLTADKKTTQDVLRITMKDLFERRLQTIVMRKGLARSTKQARQFITHEHIFVDNKKITSPSYLVQAKEEFAVNFDPKSSLFSEDHPERFKPEPVAQEVNEKVEDKSSEETKKEKKPKSKENKDASKKKSKKVSKEKVEDKKEEKIEVEK